MKNIINEQQQSVSALYECDHEKPPAIVSLILVRNDHETTVFGPMENQSQPIGGLTFKDEIPELVQADTSTEGDTAEPRLIIPLTSGKDSRDRTADCGTHPSPYSL
ncbi:4278_t:CDS:2 [Entrophospora sp. SA101]|nr:4278_t:CDS:2 [Entrophospora sp. SA101]